MPAVGSIADYCPIAASTRMQAMLPPNSQAAAGSVAPPHQPASVTVDFGSPEGRQQAQQQPVPAPIAAAPAPRPAPAAARPQPAGTIPAGAAAQAARRQQQHQQAQQQQPEVLQKPAAKVPAAQPRSAPAAAAAPGGIPARLAGRLGTASAPANERLDSQQQVRRGAGHVCFCSWSREHMRDG